ncbi:MAG: GTP pyrophosphokinase family protein [Bacillota bacterium]|nr:GTP pyrophosphokinase family protein [Bacillota bacterium]
MLESSFDNLASIEHPEYLLEKMQPFLELMVYYHCAMLEIKTKLEVLDKGLALRSSRNPFESIKCRLKSPRSIVEKLRRKGYPLNIGSIEENLNDIAGVRVICSFPDDIYDLADSLCAQDDIKVLSRKDYIRDPKPNGYRSLHLVLQIPIFLSDGKKEMRVEVQFRTIAMDFWASLEHKVKYKKDIQNPDQVAEELHQCAEAISQLDQRMQDIRNNIA